MNLNVLLLDGDGTQTLPMAESLCRKGHIVHMFYSKKLSYGYPSRYVRFKVKCSISLFGEEVFFKYLTAYVKNNNISVVIPLSDTTASFLSKYKNDLLNICNYIVPDYQYFDLGYNKQKLMSICREHGFPHPRTIELDSVDNFLKPESLQNIDDSIFPAIIKPNYTTGARGMKYVANIDKLKEGLKSTVDNYGSSHLQEFIEKGGGQIEIQLYLNGNSDLLYSSVIYKYRFYPVNGGSSSCNVTIKDDSLVEMCYDVLKKINWIGFADFDLIEDPKDGIVKFMELNPRVPACVKSAFMSGIDYAEIIVDDAVGTDIKEYKYTPGKKLRHIGFEVLWFLKSNNRFKTYPNWFNFFDANLSFQDFSLKDPLPFFYGTLGNIIRQLNPEFRKSKSGLSK